MPTFSRIKKPKLSKKVLLLVGLIAAILIIGIGGYGTYRFRKADPKPTPTPPAEQLPAPKIDLSPPTDTDKQEVEDHKQEIIDKQTQTPPPSTNPGNVTPVISYAGPVNTNDPNAGYETTAFVPGVYEDGGLCTATFVKGSSQVVKQAQGIKDATVTRCTPLIAAKSELSVGKWTVTVSYKSAAKQGTSAPQSFEVK